jgi:putative DNA primase/helicase
MGSLFLDILLLFTTEQNQTLFTRTLVAGLNQFSDHAWAEARKGKPITDIWLAQQLRPYGIRPRSVRLGDDTGKGYVMEDFKESFKRYIQRSEFEALVRDNAEPAEKTTP